MGNISALIIAKNEEENILKCINNIKDLATDIVLIDNGSKDRTALIAKNEGCKVYKCNSKNFAELRNFGVSKCLNEWVCVIDCDERYDKTLKKEIVKVIETKPKQEAFFVRRKEFFMNAHFATTWQPRLLKKFVKWTGVVHEKLLTDNVGKIKKGYLNHLDKNNVKKIIDRLNMYTDLEVAKLKKENKLKILMRIFLYPILIFFILLFVKKWIRGGIKGILFAACSAIYYYFIGLKLYERDYLKSNKKYNKNIG